MKYIKVDVSRINLNGKLFLDVRFNRKVTSEVAQTISKLLQENEKAVAVFTNPQLQTIDSVYIVEVDGLECKLVGNLNF